MASKLEQTTIRDFGGGWNVADSDVNLESRYQPVSENIIRGIDGSFSPRWGFKLWSDLKQGTETESAEASYTCATVETSPYVTITKNAHGFSTGEHVTISGFTDLNGVSAAEVNRVHSILVIDVDTFRIFVRVNASATSSAARLLTLVHDTHVAGGNIIHNMYFNRRLLLFTDIGEVITVTDAGAVERIWDMGKAYALIGTPIGWRWCNFVSTDSFKSTVIACNGYDKDKPLQIKADFTVEYLVDKASSSNAAVPRADYVICMQGYVIFVRTEFGDPFIEISAKATDGTFTRDPNPADAVEIDLSMQTSSVEPVVLGASRLRDKLYVAFYDKGMIGELGVYTGALHTPDFSDTISEHGAVSHRTIVPLGNDIFMCDYAGVPSVSISSASGVYVPVRLSELIAPEIQKHLANLSEDTLRTKCFAVYNKSDKSYMLFVPKYDQNTFNLQDDPIIITPELKKKNQVLVYMPDHKLFTRSKVTISGVTDIGLITAASINGTRKVVTIVDDDYFVIQCDPLAAGDNNIAGGGDAVMVSPVNDETIVYVFEYNKEMKIRRWTRFRDMNFECGCSSQRGKVFLCKGGKVYKMGDNEEPVYADFVGDYDQRVWKVATPYAVGTRVYDSSDKKVYICAAAHTSAVAGTFAEDRAAHNDNWTEYLGEPIDWEMETPWSEMRHRGRNKINKYISLDTEGNDVFTVSAFVNKIRYDKTDFEDADVANMDFSSLQFTAADTGGYGQAIPNTYSSGRRTREDKLWPFPFKGKLIRWRFHGQTRRRVKITALTMYYVLGSFR